MQISDSDGDASVGIQGNPFYEALTNSQIKTDNGRVRQQADAKAADAKKSTSEQSRESTSPTDRSEAQTMPIPDQIKNLADSIANFAKPLKTDLPKKNDPNF